MASPSLILGRYQILEEAGSGGFATVLHAFDTRLKRDVAIKGIDLSDAEQAQAHLAQLETQMQRTQTSVDDTSPPPSGLNEPNAPGPGDSQLFAEASISASTGVPGLEEARTAAHLADANIVTVYDFELLDGVAFIIMEYIEGKTLSEIIDEQGDDISLDVIAAVFSSVAHALKAAHRKHVLHLDIKPDNVIVNDQGVVKVTDFGLATLMNASGFGTTGGGTIGYMPLEQMRQQALDERTDEWSLAAVTYEMLTGENPFQAKDLKEAEEAIEEAEPLLPSVCWESMDPTLDDVLFTALSPDKEDRYDSIKEFSDELMPFLGNAREGTRELANIVNDYWPEEEDEEEEYWEPAIPLVDRISERGVSLIMGLVSMAGAVILGVVALINIHLTEASAFGLASDVPWLFWVLTAALAVVAFIRPSAGALLGFSALGVAVFLHGSYLLGLITVVVTLLWWITVGVQGKAPALCLLLQPLGGSVGFASLSPILSGSLLNVGQSLLTAVVAFFMALTLSGIGSSDLMGWGLFVNAQFGGTNFDALFLNMLQKPLVWCLGGSWILAAVVQSLCCAGGRGGLDILGAFLAAGLLIAGAITGTGLQNQGLYWVPEVFMFMGALIPGVFGIILAILGVPRRARWAPDQNDMDS